MKGKHWDKHCRIVGCMNVRQGSHTSLCREHKIEWMSDKWTAEEFRWFVQKQEEKLANASLWPDWK